MPRVSSDLKVDGNHRPQCRTPSPHRAPHRTGTAPKAAVALEQIGRLAVAVVPDDLSHQLGDRAAEGRAVGRDAVAKVDRTDLGKQRGGGRPRPAASARGRASPPPALKKLVAVVVPAERRDRRQPRLRAGRPQKRPLPRVPIRSRAGPDRAAAPRRSRRRSASGTAPCASPRASSFASGVQSLRRSAASLRRPLTSQPSATTSGRQRRDRAAREQPSHRRAVLRHEAAAPRDRSARDAP